MAKGEEPPTPRPAATVILLRRGGKHTDRGLELLMVRRNPDASFMPGVWVFPGGAVDREDGEGEQGYRNCAVRELREETGIELDSSELVLYSRWITPRFVERVRFDTRFYLALAPAHTSPKPDGREAVDATWISPAEALERHAAEEMPLVFPTIKHLESLTPYATSEEALEAARGKEIVTVEPRVEGEGDERRIVLPQGSGFD